MPYSASHLQLLIHSILGIWGKCKESKRKKEALKSKKKDTDCEKGGSELLRKAVKEIEKCEKFLGCQESSYHWDGGADCGKESFGEWIDGVRNCCSKEL